MKTTTDTYTGKPFRWNDTVEIEYEGRRVTVPARMTSRVFTHLHPARVPAALLAKLNQEQS